MPPFYAAQRHPQCSSPESLSMKMLLRLRPRCVSIFDAHAAYFEERLLVELDSD